MQNMSIIFKDFKGLKKEKSVFLWSFSDNLPPGGNSLETVLFNLTALGAISLIRVVPEGHHVKCCLEIQRDGGHAAILD